MRKILSIATIIVFCLIELSGQIGFNKTYDKGVSQSMLALLYVKDTLNMFGTIYTEGDLHQKYLLMQLDTSGNVIKWLEIQDPQKLRQLSSAPGISITKDKAGNIILPNDYAGYSECGLIKINTFGMLDFMTEYDFGNDRVVIINAIICTDENGYIFTGSAQRLNYDVDAFVLKTTSEGEKEWLRYFGSNGSAQRGFSIVQINSNEYVIGGINNHRSYIFAIDSLGVKKWEWIAQDSTDIMAKSLHKEPNGDWVYVSYASRPTIFSVDPELDPTFDVSLPVFIRRDSTMQLLERKEIGPFAYQDEAYTMIPSRDGGWLTAGISTQITDEGWVDTFQTLYGRVVKLDYDGNIEWSVKDTAFYSRYYSQSYLSGIAESPTGSIYAVGYCDHPVDGVWRSYGWLLKITADGCIDTLCTTTSLLDQLEKLNTRVTVYPNPATDYLIFRIDKELHDVQAEIYDLQGRLIQRQGMQGGVHALMFERQMPAGIYLWRVVTREGLPAGNGKVVIE